jgi:putative transcriptional regulator
MKKAKTAGKSESKRDLNAELRAAISDMSKGRWARKTVFTQRADGSMRRRIVLPDGTVEKDEIVPASEPARIARAGTGMSQSRFAGLIGVSVRTLQEWEQGRKRPSGPAEALLRLVAKQPQVAYVLDKKD